MRPPTRPYTFVYNFVHYLVAKGNFHALMARHPALVIIFSWRVNYTTCTVYGTCFIVWLYYACSYTVALSLGLSPDIQTIYFLLSVSARLVVTHALSRKK